MPRLPLIFSCLGHAYMHLFTAFYFVIVLALEVDWGRPYHELIALWTLGSLLVGLAALPAGWLGDRWSAGGMMVVFFVGLGLSGILCGLISSESALLVGLSAIGLFAAIYHPVGIPWLVRNAQARGKALGINGIFGGIGVAVAGLVAGTLIDLFGWRAAFILPGVVSLITGLLLWLLLALGYIGDREAAAAPASGDSRRERLRGVLVLLVTMFAMGLIFHALQTAVPKVFDLRLREIAGEGAFGIGALVAGVYGAGALMQVVGGMLADRYPLKPIYVGTLLFQVPALALVAVMGGLPLIALVLLCVTFSTAALPAENILLSRFAPARHQSLAFGVKYVIAFTSGPLAIQLVALVQEMSGEFVWLFAALAALAGLATASAFLLPGHRPAPRPLPAE